MKPTPPVRQDRGKSRALRWLSWIVLLVWGGSFLVALVTAIVNSLKDGVDAGKLVIVLSLVLFAALALWLKTTLHPIRARSDVGSLGKAQFTGHTEQEIQRFIRVVGESFGFRAEHWSKLRPDDRLASIEHQWSGGDGMEVVELVMAVECEYSLELPEEFLTTDKTLGELFAYVTRPVTGRSAPVGAETSQPNQSLP